MVVDASPALQDSIAVGIQEDSPTHECIFTGIADEVFVDVVEDFAGYVAALQWCVDVTKFDSRLFVVLNADGR